jgi:hypothetical protein
VLVEAYRRKEGRRKMHKWDKERDEDMKNLISY